LEEGESTRPRRTTLQALASFYGLNGEFLARLAAWSSRDLREDDLHDQPFALAATELDTEPAGLPR
jgi:hypothetical protein